MQLLQAMNGLHSSKGAPSFKQGTAFIQARSKRPSLQPRGFCFLLDYKIIVRIAWRFGFLFVSLQPKASPFGSPHAEDR